MSNDDKDPKSPATTSCAYDEMLVSWALIDSLLGGTPSMRRAGEQFTPRHESETDLSYQARIEGAVLLNMVEQTLETLVSKPFSQPLKPNDDIPEALQPLLDDIDLQGNNLGVFSRMWFREGFSKAFAHVLIDVPKPAEALSADGKPRRRSRADDRKEGRRPYWNMIKPENVLFGWAEVVNGVEVIKHLRILETYTVMDGFAEVSKPRIRVLTPGFVELYEPKPRTTAAQKEEWIRVDNWATGIDYVPLVTFYADRQDFLRGKPPLEDLAWLNVTHWQSTSEQRHVLSVARFPMLACSGASAEDSDDITIGPDKVLYNKAHQSKFYYVEHTGAAIEQGWTDLEQLERQMAGYGAEFLKEKPGDETATARALDSAEASTDLASKVVLFEDAVAQALAITADMMGLGDKGGTVELVKKYAAEEADAVGLAALEKAREKRDISRKTYLTGLMLRKVLPEDYDMDEDMEELKDEVENLVGAAALDLDPAGGDDPADKKDPAPADKKPVKKPAEKKPAKKPVKQPASEE